MSFLGLLSLVGAVCRIAASVFLGKYADKRSFSKMLQLCYCLAAAGYGAAAFSGPENGYILYPVYILFSSAAMGGINSSVINLIYDYVSPMDRTTALAVRQTVYGITGFLTSTVATSLLRHIQNAGNRFLCMQIYAQQLLSVIAMVGTLLVLLYVNRVVAKLPQIQESPRNQP